jgi:general secretion pathway protein K
MRTAIRSWIRTIRRLAPRRRADDRHFFSLKLPSPWPPLKSQKGVALLIALFAFSLLSFIAIEVAYDTSVEHVVSSQQVNRIKAYYAAKAGVEISLLRIMLYKQVVATVGDQLPSKGMLDPIWAFPFMPAAGDGVSEVDKSMIGSAVKESIFEGQYATTITPEGGRIDINDLGSEVQVLKKAMMTQVQKVFETEVENNEEFADKYRGYRWDELVANIADYIDEDKEATLGGDESAPYRDHEDKDYEMPPNRPLRTVDELHQIGGMKDDFYKVLAPKITVFGTKGINVNYADKDVIKALDITMTEEAVAKIIERRSDVKLGGPFKDDADFFNFASQFNVNTKAIQEAKVPLLYDVEYNFRVVSTGISSNVKREITAITFDYENLTERYMEMLKRQEDEDKKARGETPPADPPPEDKDGDGKPDPSPAKKLKAPKGRPTVVYWEEN